MGVKGVDEKVEGCVDEKSEMEKNKIVDEEKEEDEDSTPSGCWIKLRFIGSFINSRSKVDTSITGTSTIDAMACIQEMRNAGRAMGAASILGIGTAVPPNCYLQSEYTDYYFGITNSHHMTNLKNKAKQICESAMIKKRYLVHTEEMLRNNPNMCEYMAPSFDARQKILATEISALGKEAAEKAIEEWGQDKSKITHLIFCNTGCVQTPGSDFMLSRLLGLNPTVNRFMINMQGCFAGAAALRLAKDLAENNKGARVLVVCAESSVFWFRGPSEEAELDSLITQLLFSDGASALVVGSDPVEVDRERPIFEILSASQSLIPETAAAVSLDVQEAGLIVHLAKEVPTLIGDKIEGIMTDAFEPLGITDWNSLFWVAHPGGRAILDRIDEMLSLTYEKMRASRHVLSEYGNMIGACVFFVLDEVRKKSVQDSLSTTGEGHEWGVLLGFGPGLTVETVVLRSVPL